MSVNAVSSPLTTRYIVDHPYFKLGRADMKAGRGFCKEYETAVAREQHIYEKGRMAQLLMNRYGYERLTLKIYKLLQPIGGV